MNEQPKTVDPENLRVIISDPVAWQRWLEQPSWAGTPATGTAPTPPATSTRAASRPRPARRAKRQLG